MHSKDKIIIALFFLFWDKVPLCGIQLLGSCDPPTPAFHVAGTTGRKYPSHLVKNDNLGLCYAPRLIAVNDRSNVKMKWASQKQRWRMSSCHRGREELEAPTIKEKICKLDLLKFITSIHQNSPLEGWRCSLYVTKDSCEETQRAIDACEMDRCLTG